MNRFLKKYRGSYLKNDAGVAALMGVVIALVIVATLAFGFWAEVQQKQAGGAVTYTSTNAFLLAESGIRYAEKCILASSPDTNCACTSLTTGCAIASALGPPFAMQKTFGDGRGSFKVTFAFDSANTLVTATSVGTFAGAQREFKKVLCQATGCPLQESPITACTKLEISNNSSTNIPIPNPPPVCPTPPLVKPLVFPAEPHNACPDANYTDFVQATTPLGSLGVADANGFQELLPFPAAGKFQYCNMTLTGTIKVKTAANATVWIGKNFKTKDHAVLLVNGTGLINVGGKADMKNVSDIRIADGGSLTLQTDGDFSMKNSSGMNTVGDGTGTPDPDPASLIVLVGKKAKLKNSSTLIGALVANNAIEMKNNSLINGSIMGDKVELENNATINFFPTAGTGTVGITTCSGGSSGSGTCPTVLFVK